MEQLSEVFLEIADLANRVGASPINALPGCWEYQVGPQWWIAVNGHREERQTSGGTAVPGFHAYIEFNGWPWGVISPRGGVCGRGEAANEDTLIAALRAHKPEEVTG